MGETGYSGLEARAGAEGRVRAGSAGLNRDLGMEDSSGGCFGRLWSANEASGSLSYTEELLSQWGLIFK